MQIDGYTRLAAVVADPIKHSLSPIIHNKAFEQLGINGLYLAWEVREKDLIQALSNIRMLNMYGVNLSAPYKQLAMWYVNDLSEEAKLIGAINTIVNKEGTLVGHNTDGIGFFKALDVDFNFEVRGKIITIIGGGGAALSLIVQAALQGARQIHVFARRSVRFSALADKLATISHLTRSSIGLKDLMDSPVLQEKISQSNLLVNATTVGMKGDEPLISEHLVLPAKILVVDVTYKTRQTRFLKWAQMQGVKTANGLGMLLYQAAESFYLWTGEDFPLSNIRKVLEGSPNKVKF